MEKWIKEIESKENIEILFACEGGSHAWGTSSSISDYDIRFIFKHKSVKSYVSLTKQAETIELSTPYDIQGWDILKAFHLVKKSNPSLYEWVFSPIVYRDKDGFSTELKKVILESYSSLTLVMHYLHVMSKNLNEVKRKVTFQLHTQKQLIHAVRSYLICSIIINDQSITKGPYQLGKSTDKHTLERYLEFYQPLVEAKVTDTVIPLALVEDIVHTLEMEKETLVGKAKKLPTGKDCTPVLNRWIWDLLNV
ncbi:DNA polymerase beta superfamily protein [Cytobacillus sp. FJAT-54145]|uniref:DNA polymerase beta superfamily protein n=1 Tax=Cytobacillus spartinae TaxID=3299023 RepID=A0ABW6KD50_9BACI